MKSPNIIKNFLFQNFFLYIKYIHEIKKKKIYIYIYICIYLYIFKLCLPFFIYVSLIFFYLNFVYFIISFYFIIIILL